MSREILDKAAEALRKNRWTLLLLLCGAALLLLTGSHSPAGGRESDSPSTEEEQRLTQALTRMEGVGDAVVLLSRGSGRNDGYTGAVVICQGAADPSVRLRIVETVAAFTQLGSNRIVVQKMSS